MNSGTARSHLAQLQLKPRALVALTFMSARLLAAAWRSPDTTEDNQTSIIIHPARDYGGLSLRLGMWAWVGEEKKMSRLQMFTMSDANISEEHCKQCPGGIKINQDLRCQKDLSIVIKKIEFRYTSKNDTDSDFDAIQMLICVNT